MKNLKEEIKFYFIGFIYLAFLIFLSITFSNKNEKIKEMQYEIQADKTQISRLHYKIDSLKFINSIYKDYYDVKDE